MNEHRKAALPIVARAWEGSYGHTFGAHLDAEERALRFESEVTRLRECLARCGALALKFSDMTHGEECDARNCDDDGDCQCDGPTDEKLVHSTECTCGVWATRDIAAMTDAALAIGQSQGHPECPCSSSVEEPGPHIAECPYVDENYEPGVVST